MKGAKFIWLLKIFGSAHYISDIPCYFACYFEMYNQKKNALSRQPFLGNTSNAILPRVENLSIKMSQIYKFIRFINIY